MRGRRTIQDSDEIKEINISPLIDMVFILLIFFIVTTVFVEESGMGVDRPQSASASMSESESLIFEVNAKGQVLLEGRDVGVGGVRALVREQVRRDDSPIIVKAKEGALAGMVMSVVDEARMGGAKDVSLATDKDA
jgi:biopolymer transport protein ExbD